VKRYDGSTLRVVKSESVAPKLCRDCRFCRPGWPLAVPVLGWLPPFSQMMWRNAQCRHPSSIYVDAHQDLVTGAKPKRQRLLCDSARRDRTSDARCGATGRFWTARRAPTWVYQASMIIAGLAVVALYVLLLTVT
jgi:hypothetical protein